MHGCIHPGKNLFLVFEGHAAVLQVAETATQFFISGDRPNVAGLGAGRVC